MIIAKTDKEKAIKAGIPDDIPIYCKKVIISDHLPSSIDSNTIIVSTKKMDTILPYFDLVYGQFAYSPIKIEKLGSLKLPIGEFMGNLATQKQAVIYTRVFEYYAKHGFRRYFLKWAKKNKQCPKLLEFILANYVIIKKLLNNN